MSISNKPILVRLFPGFIAAGLAAYLFRNISGNTHSSTEGPWVYSVLQLVRTMPLCIFVGIFAVCSLFQGFKRRMPEAIGLAIFVTAIVVWQVWFY